MTAGVLNGFKASWELKSGIIVSNLFNRWDEMGCDRYLELASKLKGT